MILYLKTLAELQKLNISSILKLPFHIRSVLKEHIQRRAQQYYRDYQSFFALDILINFGK